MAHAKLSPSKRHRWMACPGSIREEAKYPEAPSGPAAIDGTRSHTLLEHCIKNDLSDPLQEVGIKWIDIDGTFTIDKERADRVKVAIDYIKGRVAEGCDVISEAQVTPNWLLGRDDMHGTVDVQLWNEQVYELVDYKDGMNPVDAKDNAQLEQYAFGVLSQFNLAPWEVYPFHTVRLTIVQPKLVLKGLPPITYHELSVKDLLAKVPDIIREAAATDDPDAPLVPGEKQCRFCVAKGGCAALASKAMEEVGLLFKPVSDAPEVAQQAADKDPSVMSNDQLGQLLESLPLMRQLIENTEAEALKRFQSGQSIPGFKLVRGRGSRAWSLPEDEMITKLVKCGLPKSSLYVTKLVSPSQVEKLTWSKRDGTQCQPSPRELMKIDEFISKNDGKLTVAPASDPRPSEVKDAAALFSPVTVAPVEQLPAWLVS